MKKMASKIWLLAMLCGSGMALAAYPAPDNPATGIWIQQVGDIVPHNDTRATLYYTVYSGSQYYGVKSVDYYYDGAGYLQLLNKNVICRKNTEDGMAGADGIVHHPDGDLLVAAQGHNVHKVSKTAKAEGGRCLIKTSTEQNRSDGKGRTEGFWHLMMDPNGKTLWAAGIPGQLYRFSTEMGVNAGNFADKGYYVELDPDAKIKAKSSIGVSSDKLATVIWNAEGHAFFTYSDYHGGGCETYVKGEDCPRNTREANRAKAFFGHFIDTTWTVVTEENVRDIGGKVGDSVITKLKTELLIDSLEGAHGGTYDSYSNTIFVFGGSKIHQILPYMEGGKIKARVVASIDLREYFFKETEQNLTQPRTNDGGLVGWRLDQGTVDGMGHLFVASNTGHLVFVDYAANPNRYINDNVLVHLQWIDNYLDDLAPLSGVGISRTGANTGEDGELSSSSKMSSALVEYSSSSSVRSSSSAKSSSSVRSSSSIKRSSSSLVVYSSSVRSSSSKKSSSSSANSSSSSGTTSSSGVNSSSSGANSPSGGVNGSSGSVNSSCSGGSSGNNGGSSSSNGTGGSSGNVGSSSSLKSSASTSSSGTGGTTSSSKNQGSGRDIVGGSSSSNRYAGFTDFDLSSNSGLDFYPSQDKFDDGDSLVSTAKVLVPVDSVKGTKGTVTVGENTYLVTNNPTGVDLDLRYNSNIDSAQVGQLVAITLDSAKIVQIFGNVDSLTIATDYHIDLIDPTNPHLTDTIRVASKGDVTIWVTADEAIKGGSFIVADPGGRVVIVDNINFYDPIPDADKGYIKDSDGDDALDYVEIVLKDTLEAGLSVYSVALVVKGDTLPVAAVPNVDFTDVYLNSQETRRVNTISLDVSDLKFPDKFPKDAYAIITYETADGAHYTRNASLFEIGSQVIKAAEAIRSSKGKDSLFVEFNVDLLPIDLSDPEMLVMIKQNSKRFGFVGQITNVYMPTKNLVILVGDSLGLKGGMKDSVSLYPNVVFHNLPYVTSDEYDREVPVKVTERLPSVKNVEYWDTDGDGQLDKVITNFVDKLTPEEVGMLYMSFPWYSDRGMLIQLQAQPSDLALAGDSMSVSWNVFATQPIVSGVTSISEDLPQATIYTYYPILGEIFVNEEAAPLVDKMSPVIAGATLSYGSKADTLTVMFSEAILFKNLEGRDFFSYIHGKDTIDLLPKTIEWSDDGKFAKLIIDGGSTTILPGDSLMVVRGQDDNIRDNYGNIAGENPQAVVIAGLLNHLVEATKMGSFDANDDRIVDENGSKSYTLQTGSSVNLRYVPGSTTKEEGALGQLVQLGERFVPQLLDRAQISADGTVDPSVLDSLDPAKVYITFVVNYNDHLGQYVNDTTIMVPCNSPKFGGNCLNSDQKVFVNWNFKDHTGRFVGTGIYMVQFKMVVRYESRKIEEEIKDKWGVRRKKHKK